VISHFKLIIVESRHNHKRQTQATKGAENIPFDDMLRNCKTLECAYY